MNETTELIMKQLNSKKVHAETHEVGGGDEIDVLKLKNINNYVTKTGDFSGTWNGLQMTSTEPGLSSAFNALKADVAQQAINVKSAPFNAKGDGVTDDTTAIIAARDYVYSNKGILYFPPGTYKITSNITFDKAITIKGSGSANKTDVNTKTRILCTTSTAGFTFDPGVLEWGFQLEDFEINGNVRTANVGITFENNQSARSLIQNVAFVSFAQFGLVDDSDNGNIYNNCIFQSNGTTSATLGGALIKRTNIPKFNNCYFIWNGSGIVSDAQYGGNYGITLLNCDIEGNYYHGVNIISTGTYGSQNGYILNTSFEMNNQSGSANIRDINLIHANSSKWNIEKCRFSEATTATQYNIYSEGWYTVLAHLSFNGGSVTGAVVKGIRSQLIGDVKLHSASFPLPSPTHSNGYKLSAYGKYQVNGNGVTTVFQVAHGLYSTPTKLSAVAGSVDARGLFHVSADATNLTFTYATAPPTGSGGNLVIYYDCSL